MSLSSSETGMLANEALLRLVHGIHTLLLHALDEALPSCRADSTYNRRTPG